VYIGFVEIYICAVFMTPHVFSSFRFVSVTATVQLPLQRYCSIQPV